MTAVEEKEEVDFWLDQLKKSPNVIVGRLTLLAEVDRLVLTILQLKAVT